MPYQNKESSAEGMLSRENFFRIAKRREIKLLLIGASAAIAGVAFKVVNQLLEDQQKLRFGEDLAEMLVDFSGVSENKDGNVRRSNAKAQISKRLAVMSDKEKLWLADQCLSFTEEVSKSGLNTSDLTSAASEISNWVWSEIEPDVVNMGVERKKNEALSTEAIGLLYQRYFPNILNYFKKRKHDDAEAEDLAQNVFNNVIARISEYQQRGKPFGAVLFRTAHNLRVNVIRGKINQKTGSLEEVTDNPVAKQSGMNNLWRDVKKDNPEGILIEKEKRGELIETIAKLNPERQNLLVYKYVLDMSNREIGQRMGRTEGAVKSLLVRTIEDIRLKMGVNSKDQLS